MGKFSFCTFKEFLSPSRWGKTARLHRDIIINLDRFDKIWTGYIGNFIHTIRNQNNDKTGKAVIPSLSTFACKIKYGWRSSLSRRRVVGMETNHA